MNTAIRHNKHIPLFIVNSFATLMDDGNVGNFEATITVGALARYTAALKVQAHHPNSTEAFPKDLGIFPGLFEVSREL